MKYNSLKYIIASLALLGVSQLVNAQYKSGGGVSTAKSVSERHSDGSYTITLETFGEGSSESTTTYSKKDVVLVLDVSGSMDFPKGPITAETKNFSYNDIANSDYTYFYKDNDGDYWKVYPSTTNYSGTTYYHLTYYPASPTHIGRDSAYSTNPNEGLGNRTLYRGTESRMDALKTAVTGFIDNIYKDDTTDKNGKPRAKKLGNRISIIKFAADRSNTVGITYDSNNFNHSQIVRNFTELTAENVTALKNDVESFISSGGTQAWVGMDLAVDVLGTANANANKIVVFFTDGLPNNNNYSAVGNTNNGGNRAYAAKNTYNATVYSIGLFTTSPGSTTDTYRYLQYVSSNYPKATYSNSTLRAGEGGDANGGYYKDASGNVDLNKIFEAISDDIGRQGDVVDETSQVRDIVSSSFKLPIDVAEMSDAEKAAWVENNVNIYTKKVSETGTDGWQDDDYDLSGVTATIGLDENGHGTLNVTGFDFTADDSEVGAGDGNWVGTRKVTVDGVTTTKWYGRKLVIEFNIVEAEDVTGGDATNTNTKDSGVYVLKDGVYVNVNPYEIPHTNLPVNIRIKKDGLRHGESATFEIWRAVPKLDANGKIVYNDIGKPTPDESKWEDWSKVILTNKGADGDFVEKTLLALDPSYVYKVVEDAWGWAYTLSHTGGDLTTATVEVNPFTFTNKEKTNVPKHAEAVTINHFGLTIQGGEFQGKQEEHYKSSKVQSFSK